MLVVALLVQRLVHGDAIELQHVQHRKPRIGRALEDAQQRAPELVGQLRCHVVEVDGGGDDGRVAGFRLAFGRAVDQRMVRLAPALEDGEKTVLLQSFGARRELHLGGISQVMRQLRRRGVAAAGLHLEAAQHDLLEPRRDVRLQLARWSGVAPQPLLQALELLRVAEGPDPRGEEIHQAADGEDVAPRIAADAQHLFGRHVGRCAIGHAEFLLHQVRQVAVVGQAIIDQHGFARRPEHDVRRLDVEVDDTLAVQRLHGIGNARADRRHLLRRHRHVVDLRQQGFAGQPLHHDIGLHGEIAIGDVARHMRPLEARHDHLLHLEADDGGGVLTFLQHGDLHQERGGIALFRHLPQAGHAAAMDEGAYVEAVEDGAGVEPGFRHWVRFR